jgi:hypothetical protein
VLGAVHALRWRFDRAFRAAFGHGRRLRAAHDWQLRDGRDEYADAQDFTRDGARSHRVLLSTIDGRIFTEASSHRSSQARARVTATPHEIEP